MAVSVKSVRLRILTTLLVIIIMAVLPAAVLHLAAIYTTTTAVLAAPSIQVKEFRIYVSTNALKHVSYDQLVRATPNVHVFKDIIDLGFVNKSVIVITPDEFRSNLPRYHDFLLRVISENVSIALAFVGGIDSKILGTMLKVFSNKNVLLMLPILLAEPGSSLEPQVYVVIPELLEKVGGAGKTLNVVIHPELFRAEAIVFTFNPNGIIVIEEMVDPAEMLSLAYAMYVTAGKVEDEVKELVENYGSIVANQGFEFVGYIGWIAADFVGSVCNEVTGYMAVKVDYYYVKGRYEAWLAHVKHGVAGYRTNCPLGPVPWYVDHYPKRFLTVTSWGTDVWPGQVLFDWGPKNIGTAATITYTMSAAVTVGPAPSVTIQYSVGITEPNAPYFEWYDESDPPRGVHRVEHILVVPEGYDRPKLSGRLFVVEPASIGILDPSKPYGYPPVILSHVFYAELNTGDSATISFSAYLYPTAVYYRG